MRLPLKVWEWYGFYQQLWGGTRCPAVEGHGLLCQHSVFRITLCALRFKVITVADLEESIKLSGGYLRPGHSVQKRFGAAMHDIVYKKMR